MENKGSQIHCQEPVGLMLSSIKFWPRFLALSGFQAEIVSSPTGSWLMQDQVVKNEKVIAAMLMHNTFHQRESYRYTGVL